MGATAVGATVYFGSDGAAKQIVDRGADDRALHALPA